jgi:hypothetical protein
VVPCHTGEVAGIVFGVLLGLGTIAGAVFWW